MEKLNDVQLQLQKEAKKVKEVEDLTKKEIDKVLNDKESEKKKME